MIIGKKVKKPPKQGFIKSKQRINITPGAILHIHREKNNLTQNELSKLTGLTQATISSLESDRITLGVERAKMIAKALHVHPAVLIFPDWEMKIKAG